MGMGEAIREYISQRPFSPFRVILPESIVFKVDAPDAATVDESGEVLEVMDRGQRILINIRAILYVSPA